MTPVGFTFPPLPAAWPVAPMPFTIDDSFYDDLGASLPACSVLFLNHAASWSARNSKSGFVPAWLAAKLSGSPDLSTGPLRAIGVITQVKGGAWQIVPGKGVTIINADDVKAEAERVREAAKQRQRKSRENRKTERREMLNAGVNDVTCDIPVRSHVTPQIDRSDLSQSSRGQSQSKSDARARESPELVTAVADAICAKVGYVPTDDQAREAITIIRRRARESKTRIRSALAYIPAAISNEPDLWDGVLLPKLPPIAETDPPAGAWDPECHEYEPTYPGGPCRCTYTKSSPRHNVARAG